MTMYTVGSLLDVDQTTYPDIRSLNETKSKNDVGRETAPSFAEKVSGEQGKIRQLLAGLMNHMSSASALSGGDSAQAMTDFARMSVDLLGMEKDIKNQETQGKIANSLEKQVETQEATLAAQMIGRKTEAEISTLTLDNTKEKPKISYDMPSNIASASVVIRSLQGEIVYVDPLTDLAPGQNRAYEWDGKIYTFEQGEWRLKDAQNGPYKISILGETRKGDPVRLPTFSKEVIESIKLPNANENQTRAAFHIGGGELTWDQLRTLSNS